MPRIGSSSYRAPLGLRNGHALTICPLLFRRVPFLTTRRERIETPDGDFLDLDWADSHRNRRLAILTHGLESNTKNAHIQGMAAALHRRGWDVLAWNLRGCSGETNRLPRSYHSGATEDLVAVLDHVFEMGEHDRIALVGFSLGGNLTLKYLGDIGTDVDTRICSAVTFSVPCDLACSVDMLSGFVQRIYMRRFLKDLRLKIKEKAAAHPGELSDEGVSRIRTFHEFDDRYTAPLHGFASADDYWTRSSCKSVLPNINVPSLLVNALDDPFLGSRCYPVEEAEFSDYFQLETPKRGGHVGFVQFGHGGEYWSETRAAEFLDS